MQTANDSTTDEQIAETILKQLGGNKFLAMTGARNLLAVDKGLRFNLPGYKVNTVIISLNERDLYHMTFYKVGKTVATTKILAEYDDVYAEDIQRNFTLATGLDTHL